MKLILPALLFAFAQVAGCGRAAPPPPTTTTSTEQPSSVGEFRREDDPAFTVEQRGLIAAARNRLATSDHRVNDAYHRVRSTGEGHEVFMLFVTGYDDDGRPLFRPCHHAAVIFGSDGALTKVLRGPACWP